ncbi:MAG: GAF domain-containing protein [Magnetococcales bacterium]|nr:GAF domain-containing protein [Magnetococcales bacterium]
MAETTNQSDPLQELRALASKKADSGKKSGSKADSKEEYKEILNQAVALLPDILKTERCSIFIHDPKHQRAWLQSGTGLIEKELDIPLQRSITGEVVITGQPLIVNDMRHRDGVHRDVDQMTGYNTRNVLCVPIKNRDGNKVRGTLQVINKLNNKSFNLEDQSLLERAATLLRTATRTAYLSQGGVRRSSRSGSKALADKLKKLLPDMS